MSQSALARIAGISKSYLNEIEKGSKVPTIGMVEKIGNALKMNPSKLIVFDITYKQNRKSKKSTPE